MIRSNQQFTVANTKCQKLKDAIASAVPSSLEQRTLQALLAEVESDLEEYEDIRSRKKQRFAFDNVDQLGDIAIKARLARGVTQRELADRLDVTEQVIQRYEAKGYERSSIDTVADVMDALGYQIQGIASPTSSDFVEAHNTSTAIDPTLNDQHLMFIGSLGSRIVLKCLDSAAFPSHKYYPITNSSHVQPDWHPSDDLSKEIQKEWNELNV